MTNYRFTVFTPTYNRAHLLGRLYNSLKNQTYLDFEWVIVDDGSIDNTKDVVRDFIEENKVDIKYTKQSNGGKHRAINKGLEMAKGELFFIVDSDDYLTDRALEILIKNWDEIEDKNDFCGVSGLKGFSIDTVVGTTGKDYIMDISLLDYRYKYKIKGDKSEVFVTDILRENKFPEIDGEKFISESIVWNRLGNSYKMRWVNEIVYICDYIEGGLTDNSLRLRIDNIHGTLKVYESNLIYNIPFFYKVRSAINYYRFLFHSNLDFKDYKLSYRYFSSYIIIFLGKSAQVIDLLKSRFK